MSKATMKDYELISVLGQGEFGKVKLAKRKKDNKLYAIKILYKKSFV